MCKCTFSKFMLVLLLLILGWPIVAPVMVVLTIVIGAIVLLFAVAVAICVPKKKPLHKGKKFTFKKS